MSSTGKVLGSIGAINTLINNFPMSIFELFKGKTYTSVFDFIIDVLAACGVNVSEITDFLIKEIYSVDVHVDNLNDFLQNNYLDDNLSENQSEFLRVLEVGIKGILMALLSGFYTCSAKPTLPNKFMDRPSKKTFTGVDEAFLNLWNNDNKPSAYPFHLNIPISHIDPMGILSIPPTTSEGRLYYMVEGRDIYYKRTKIEKPNLGTTYFSKRKNELSNNIEVFLKLTDKNEIEIKLSENSPQNLDISIGYIAYGENNLSEWDTVIEYGEVTAKKIFKLLPKKDGEGISQILWIKINGEYQGVNSINNDWIYLSKEKSKTVIDFWNENGANTLERRVKWDTIRNDNDIILSASDVNEYQYVACKYTKECKSALRFTSVPDANNVTAEYVVVYNGLTASNLYKTYDMNAFIWYVLNRGMLFPQVEYNHMMWDNRLFAKRKGIIRSTPEEWNEWYNSKQTNDGEFLYPSGNTIKNTDDLFPLLQIEPPTNGTNDLRVIFPAQKFLKPKLRGYNNGEKWAKVCPKCNGIGQVDGENCDRCDGNGVLGNDINSVLSYNTSIYKFNWLFLESIQILRPKLMLTGLLNYLLGYTISTAESISITRKIIEGKLSSAVKKIIETDDMEVEDCYTTFSNDEYDELLESMLLSKYNATYYGVDGEPVKTHDIEDYINQINSINSSATKEENINTITRLVTEVTASPGTQTEINYGLSDGNLLKKLIWAIVMPIIESLFTPQVMLLLYINLEIMGIVKFDKDNLYGFILNQILGLIKSIILFVKDKIIELLLKLFYEKIMPLLILHNLKIIAEKLEYWLDLLRQALACLPRFKFPKRPKIIGTIDEVDYADITTTATTPERELSC